MDSLYSTYTRPELAGVLKKLRLDYEILSASGKNIMIRKEDGKELKVLDLIGGYGSCLLGHNPPEVVHALIGALQKETVNHAQLSMREKAGKLSEELNKRARQETGKSFITTLANTGAEAVEAAMKHALLGYHKKIENFISSQKKVFRLMESRDQSGKVSLLKRNWLEQLHNVFNANPGVFLALKGSFHGKTLGALSLTSNKKYRTGLSGALQKCAFIGASKIDVEHISKEFAFQVPFPEVSNTGEIWIKEKPWLPFVAFFAEPIQGEAGVIPLSGLQAQNIRNCCNAFQIPLVWDEIQSGCYRTGNLFASSSLSVAGDYYLLGKSLGGGMAKVSALMVEEKEYINNFGLIHTSTFAEDELSSIVASTFLKAAEKLPCQVAEEGAKWKQMLSGIKQKFPGIIKEVRGKGLILGIEFSDFNLSACYGFQSLSRGGYFNYLLSAWMFHHHHIRLSAPLSNSFTLRFHPPVGCTQDDLAVVEAALEQLCCILEWEDLYALIAFLLPAQWQAARPYPRYFAQGKICYEQAESAISKVAFVTHYIDEKTIATTSPSLACLPLAVLEEFLEDFLEMLSPAITGGRMVEADKGQKVHLTMVGAPFTSAMAKKALEGRRTHNYRGVISRSVEMLETEINPSFIGLGQYSSIVCNNGLAVSATTSTLTTGNGYTAFHAAESLLFQCKITDTDPANERLAVFGAGGNIGGIMTALLISFVKEVYLFGNPSNSQKASLKNLKIELSDLYPHKTIIIAEEVAEAKKCRLVVAATNQPVPFLNEGNLHARAIISDVSVPRNICSELLENPGNRFIVQGGIATLPDGKAVPSKGFPLPKGKTFACMAETLLLGLSKQTELASVGPLQFEKVQALGKLGQEYGFSAENVITLQDTFTA